MDNDKTERRFTFNDMKRSSNRAANYFRSIGIKKVKTPDSQRIRSVLHFRNRPTPPFLIEPVAGKDILAAGKMQQPRNGARIVKHCPLRRSVHKSSAVGRREGSTDGFSRQRHTTAVRNEKRTVATESILNYLRFCADAFLLSQVKRQDLQGKQILATNEKYYIADHGIREAVYGGNMRDINLILENIVYLELLRRGYTVTVGKAGDKEIDFVCEKRGQKLYVQVTYLLASPETIDREFRVYDSIRDNFPKYVVSLDEFDMSRDGIKHLNIREFLLKPEWN